MKLIERGEVLGLADYETVRERFRTRIVAEKRQRRVQLGPKASVLFENRETALLQIQEMLRTERITRPAAIQHEIDTYNELVPGDDEISCTMMLEIPEKDERDAFLRSAAGLERHVWIASEGERVLARSRDRAAEAEHRTTAVHYLKFALSGQLATSFRDAVAARRATSLRVELEIDHPAYQARATLPPETILLLGEDLKA